MQRQRRSGADAATLAVPPPALQVGEATQGNQVAQDALSASSEERLLEALDLMKGGLAQYRGWRSGASLGSPLGEWALPLDPLTRATDRLRGPWERADGEWVQARDPAVREALASGVRGVPSLSTEEIGLVEEWLSHHPEEGRDHYLTELYCLSPRDLNHQLSMQVHWERELSGGFSPGGACANVGLFAMDVGACAGGGMEIASLTMAYRNDTGMGWSADYHRASAKVFVSAGLQLELVPALYGPTDHGKADLCTGSARHDRFIGPLSMRGLVAENSASGSGGVGLDGEESLFDFSQGIGRYSVRSAQGDIVFDTSGACGSVRFGAGGQVEVKRSLGYQRGPEDVAGQPADAVAPVGVPGFGRCPVPEQPRTESEEVLLRASFYFPRGSADPYGHLDNAQVLGEISLGLLAEADAHGVPSGARLEVVGHASPVWEAAASDEARVAANDALARERAEVVSQQIVKVYDAFGGRWPALTSDQRAEQHPGPWVHGAGASEGQARTGDPGDATPEHQRVDVVVWVRRRR